MSKRKSSELISKAKRPRAKGEQFRFLSVDNSTNINKDVSLTFSLQSGPDECVRFGENPIFIKYKVRYKNPAFGIVGAPPETPAYIYLKGAHKDLVVAAGQVSGQNVHLNPLLGPASFFVDMEVKIDHQDINEKTKLEAFNFIYTAWEKTFMSLEDYKKTYLEDRLMISTEQENQLDSEIWKKVAKKMDFGSTLEGQAMSILERFNMQGIFPLSPFSNVLSALRKKENTRGWFAPLKSFEFRLIKRQPVDEAVERVGGYTDKDYFTGDMPAEVKWFDLELVIEDICIMYESVKITPKNSLKGILGTFDVDVPIAIMAHLPPRQNQTSTNVLIPAGTKAVLIGFPIEDQLYFNKSSKKFLRSGVIFPPDLKELKIDLGGREDLIFRDGFTNLGMDSNQDDITCRAYYEELVRQKLYDGPIDTMFARSATRRTRYNSIIVLNLMSSHLKESQLMTITTKFGSKLSPEKTKILIFCLTTWKYAISNTGQFMHSQIL